MATLKRNDIVRKHTNRGRPPKPVKERQLKQRAAYQWRDARRIYLAGSFERWRKLKNRLQLKDSSLAWHLLETHDKGCNNCSMSIMTGDSSTQPTDQDCTDSPTKNSSEFEPALKKMLRQLCYRYLRFEECVELVGLICVEVDHKSKDNHSIKEVVRRGLAPKERTHERQQSDLEASEAEQVTIAMSRMARKDGCVVSVSGHDGTIDSASDSAGATMTGNSDVSVADVAANASLHPAQGQDHESRTSWDGGGEYCEATDPVCQDSSETDSRSIAGDREQSDTPCSMPVSQTTEVHGQPLHSYDETDYAALTAGSHQTDSNASAVASSKDDTHTLSSSWLTQSHGQHGVCMSDGSPTHNNEQCMSCMSGEVHSKVVVSGDGMVSHVVHNGPMSRQVYRIDLSNHEHSCDMEVDLGLRGSLAQPDDQAGEQSRDRAASIESTDSFMEVGIKSQINHAQRLLASPSPTDQSKPSPVPSPVVSLVADSSLRAAFDAFPSHPPDTALASDSLAMGCSPVHFDASSSHPNHTSVIKQVTHPEKAASHKTDPPACSSEASFPPEEGNASPARLSVNEGDLPLDMSVVKEEEDNTEHNAQDVRQGVKQSTTQQDEQPASHDTEDACSTSLSPPSSMHSEAAAAVAAAARDTAQLLSSSSMQHLQHYTDRLLQHQQFNVDLSLLHATFLSATDSDDSARSRKRKLSDLDDSRDGDLGKGGPWPRKDMTQKEEYQYLERDPFMDFAEMTRLFPNMQQRTFYRWKRRIKDQFIYVEQRPSLTYEEFSQYFPQVREHIFEHWQNLLTQGHRFLGDAGKSGSSFGEGSMLSSSLLKTSGAEGGGSTTVKDGEGGTKSDSFVSQPQYIFLQRNPNLNAEEFTKVFPDVPQHLFYMWKKQIFADYMKLQANPKMTYQEFRKQATAAQDVFNVWKTHLMLMANPTHLMSTCSNLVSASSTLTAPSPTLPPVSLLAARAGSKSMGPDIAACYASYAQFFGRMALPFWSPLSIISSPSLNTTFPTLRESSAVDRDTDKDQSREKVSALERLSEKDLSRRMGDLESSGNNKDAGLLDKAGEAEGSSSPQATEREGSGEGGSLGHRGRRQSLKPEHYYYLHNPDTPYLALTRIFPGVSAQRYGRWKRKVSSALAFLDREPDCTNSRFELYFPNVPDEILFSWRERVRQGHARLIAGSQESGEELSSQPLASTQPPTSHHQPLTSSSPALSGCHSRDSSVGGDAGSTGEDPASDKHGEHRLREITRETLLGPPRKPNKVNREEYLFVQRFPGVDWSTFSSYYPTISVRTFYRWRSEVHKAINMLRLKPSLNLQGFLEEFPALRERFPELSEEVFAVWQGMVREESRREAEGGSSTSQGSGGEEAADNLLVLSNASLLQQQPHTEPSTEDREPAGQQPVTDGQPQPEAVQHEDSSQRHSDPSATRSPCRQEQLLVHMNPYLDYSEMHRTYPSVTQRTFFRWKSEVREVMDYMRKHPEVVYEDIASAVPGVSLQAFQVWQQLILAEKLQLHVEQKTDTGSHYGSQAGENRSGTDSSRPSSQTVCESMSVDGSSQEKSDIGNGSSAEAAEESFSFVGNEGDELHAAKARRQTREEFIEVMLNPAMDYAEFARRFGTVSQRTFYRWRAHIRDWRAAIRLDPQLDYATFSRHARDVPEYVFKVWRDWESRMENSHSTSEGVEGTQVESSQSGVPSQPTPSTVSQASASGSSETGKSGCKQLELMWKAYDYYQSHPTVDFKGLSAVFPSVSMDMYQQWKKAVDVRMEYIRSIPSTNFEDFNRIFPDVKENIFNILKANVLIEKSAGKSYYSALSQPAADASASCLPDLQTAYSSTSQPVFPQMAEVRTGAKHDEVSDASAFQRSEGESAHQVVYPSAKPTPTHSPHLQSSPVVGVKEGLSVITTPSVANIKQEASPNTPLPSFTETVSNLSNLNRLNAMFQHRLPHATSVVSPDAPTPSFFYPQTSVTATTTATTINTTFSTTLAGIVGDSLQKALQASSTSATSSALYPSSSSHVFPLVSSTPTEPANPALYPVEEGEAGGSQSTQPSAGYEEAPAGREERILDTPGHSSQRQRKLQREEYMFVEQNPDVDVQEFLSRFPRVSLRTFYRWKREIREEQARGIIGGLG